MNKMDPALNAESPVALEININQNEAEIKVAEDAGNSWVDAVVARTNDLFQKGAYREAESMLQQAIQREPGNDQLTDLLAKCREKLAEVHVGRRTMRGRWRVSRRRSRRKRLYYAVGLGAILITIIYFLFETGNGPVPSYSMKAVSENPPTPAEALPSWDLVGNWIYSMTQPDGTRMTGQIAISGSKEQFTLIMTARDSAFGPDGRERSSREQIDFAGSLAGDALTASATSGTRFVNGVAYPLVVSPPVQLNLHVSSDRLSMEGHFSSNDASKSLSVSVFRQP